MKKKTSSAVTLRKNIVKELTNFDDPPSFLLAFARVFFVAALVFLMSVAIFTCFRNFSASHINQNAIKGQHSNMDVFIGKWYIQATNNWFTVSTLNSVIDCEIKNSSISESLRCDWNWYNYFIYTQNHLSMEVSKISENIIVSTSIPIFSVHPIWVLEYEKDNHLILFAGSTALMPEGSLLVMTRSPSFSHDLHFHAKNLAKQYNVDLLQYTLVPQLSGGILDFVYALGDQMWKLTIGSVIAFVLLTQLMPHDVTALQSFSYSALPSWNVSIESFHMTTVSFCTYHQSWLARLTHLSVLGDMILWYPVLAAWGPEYMIGALTLQALQLLSYKEYFFFLITFSTYCFFALAGYYMVEYEYYCRMLLLASSFLKVAGHSLENIPPPLSGKDSFVSFFKLRFPMQFKIPFAALFGIISELATGMPTRHFTGVFYILLCKMGYSSSRFMSLEQLMKLDKAIQKEGWKGYPELHRAIKSQKVYLQL